MSMKAKKARLADSFVMGKRQYPSWIDKLPSKVRDEINEFIAQMMPGERFADAGQTAVARHIISHFNLDVTEHCITKHIREKLLELRSLHEQPQTKSGKHVSQSAINRVQATDRSATRRRS